MNDRCPNKPTLQVGHLFKAQGELDANRTYGDTHTHTSFCFVLFCRCSRCRWCQAVRARRTGRSATARCAGSSPSAATRPPSATNTRKWPKQFNVCLIRVVIWFFVSDMRAKRSRAPPTTAVTSTSFAWCEIISRQHNSHSHLAWFPAPLTNVTLRSATRFRAFSRVCSRARRRGSNVAHGDTICNVIVFS
jgi:hypothetical protein